VPGLTRRKTALTEQTGPQNLHHSADGIHLAASFCRAENDGFGRGRQAARLVYTFGNIALCRERYMLTKFAAAAEPARSLPLTRRRALTLMATTAVSTALCLPRHAAAQSAPAEPAPPPADPAPAPFSFDALTEQMRQASQQPYRSLKPYKGALAELDYDDYRKIRFRPDHARWQDPDLFFRLHAFHPGWLFKQPVELYEVVDGTATRMAFSAADFEYDGDLAGKFPPEFELPGEAGFRLHAPVNRADIYDEVVAFLGASYFRALGRGNVYGLSARGLAVNTASGRDEEFPQFTAFWLERPAVQSPQLTVYASLDSPSVTGAYRFVITPGENTVVDVTMRLFLRKDVQQLGVAPLTSMFLLGDSDPGDFDDFRPCVHDSEALILNSRGGDTMLRPLNNPPQLAASYFTMENPASFGLIQRNRDFDDYLDAGAQYERRPSLMIEPLGDWGKGTVRLVEIPSDLETNDNIVAFWVPETPARQGDALEFAYRQSWGMSPPGATSERAQILRTRVGKGGVAGVEGETDRRKFVIDFAGGTLGELPEDADVEANVTASTGKIAETVLSKIPGTGVWRLVAEVSADAGAIVELRANVSGYGRVLTETWLYQWIKK